MLPLNQPGGVSDAFREIDICAAHGTPSGEDLGAVRGALSRQPQDPDLQLSGLRGCGGRYRGLVRTSLRADGR